VEHTVETEIERVVRVVERVGVPVEPRGSDWPEMLAVLVKQLDTGRLYDRDLTALAEALNEVLQALQRRPAWSRRRRW
jgi:hypothetical protein